MGNTCATCRFFAKSNRQYASQECRRFPPIIVEHRSSCTTYRAPGWPDVTAGDWCGEHRPAHQKDQHP